MLAADILAREQVMTQVFPEIGIALFHCRSKAVKECQIITAGPDKGQLFEDPRLKDIRAALCMAMPIDEHRQQNTDMLGRISGAIVEDEAFLETLKTGDEEAIQEKLQRIMKSYFSERINGL